MLKILDEAGISAQKSFSIVEVGCACAESALSLFKRFPEQCDGYIGLTLSTLQAHIAADRVRQVQGGENPKYNVFHADAAKPNTWGSGIHSSLKTLERPWLMAIDCLFHFEPSRKPLFEFAANKLGASFALTDHVKRENLTWLERLKLHFAYGLLDTPLNNVLTRRQYVELLVSCGYEEKNITIIPTTEFVLKPYSNFIQEQGQRWQDLGGGKSDYMDFRLVGAVSSWLAKSGLVDSCIIVARK